MTVEEVRAATLIQQWYRRERAYYKVSTELGASIRALSKSNLRNLRHELAQGGAALAPYRVKNRETGYYSPEKWLHWLYSAFFGGEEPQETAPLEPRELSLMKLIVENLTLKHVTSENIEKLDELTSPRERMRRGVKVDNCRSDLTSLDEFIYFTVGISDHNTYYSSDPKHSEVFVEVDKLAKESTSLNGTFVSGHFDSYSNGVKSPPILLGDTCYSFSHSAKEGTKTYRYRRADGNRYKRVVRYEEELFFGGDLLPGIAMEMIRHLRFVGGSYREKLLSTVSSPPGGDGESLKKILSAAMQALMPGWIFPEAKMPIKFSLASSSCSKRNFAETAEKQRCHPCRGHLYRAIESCNLQELSRYVEGGGDFSLRFSDGNTPLTLAIGSERDNPPDAPLEEVVELLAANGAGLCDIDSNMLTPLAHAARTKNRAVAELLLSRGESDPNDPLIVRLLSPAVSDYVDQSPLTQLFEKNRDDKTVKTLRLLLKKGGSVKSYSHHFLSLATLPRKGEAAPVAAPLVEMLLEHGAKASECSRGEVSPLIQCVESSTLSPAHREDSLKAIDLLLRGGAAVDYQYSPPLPNPYAGYSALHIAAEIGDLAIAELLLEHGANPNLLAMNKITPLLLAVRNGNFPLEKLLRRYGAHTFDRMPSSANPLRIYSVAALVTGKDRDGKVAIVMGRKRDGQGRIGKKLHFPGGYKDFADATFEAAAIREVDEETNLKLFDKFIKGEISPRLIYLYKGSDKEGSHCYKTCFYHIELREELPTRLVAKDDLAELSLLRVEEGDLEGENPFPHREVRYSNRLIIAGLFGKGDSIHEKIQEALSIELSGVTMLKSALKAKDSAEALRILRHPSFSDAVEKKPYHLFLTTLGEEPDRAVAEELYREISSNSHSDRALLKIYYRAALYGHKKLCLWIISTNRVPLLHLFNGVKNAAISGHVALALAIFDKLTKERGERQIERALKIGCSRSLKEYFLGEIFDYGASGGRMNVIDYVLSAAVPPLEKIEKAAFFFGKNNLGPQVEHLVDRLGKSSPYCDFVYLHALRGAVVGGHGELVKSLS